MVEKGKVTRRSFVVLIDGDKAFTYYIAPPTSEDARKAEWHYSKIYNQALIEGLVTQSEMFDILTKRNIAGPNYESKGEEIRRRLLDKIEAMEQEEDLLRKKILALDVALAREELFHHNQKVNGPMSNTCEQLAEDARVEFLTSRLIEDEDGKKTWNSFEAYKEDKRTELTTQSRLEVMLWLQGLDSDFLEKTPENQVLRLPSAAEVEAQDDPFAVPEEEVKPEEVEKKPSKSRKAKG
jgi:hypothetical protein